MAGEREWVEMENWRLRAGKAQSQQQQGELGTWPRPCPFNPTSQLPSWGFAELWRSC